MKQFSLKFILLLTLFSSLSFANKAEHSEYQNTIDTYLSAWTEPDEKNREKSINQTLSRAIIFVSPETSTNKRNGVLKEIEKFQSDFKNAKLNYAPAKFSGRNAHLSWNLEGASGDNISSGYSSLTFDKKGRIVKVAVFY